jgi:hypothetical protein
MQQVTSHIPAVDSDDDADDDDAEDDDGDDKVQVSPGLAAYGY